MPEFILCKIYRENKVFWCCMFRSWIRCRIYSGEACRQEKRYFVPHVGSCALHFISLPSFPAAALCPSFPPFTAQLHFFHFTSAAPSWHTKRSKHTRVCLPALFLQLHLSTSWKMSGRGSRSLHLSLHMHRGDPSPHTTGLWQLEGHGWSLWVQDSQSDRLYSTTFSWILILWAVTENCALVKKSWMQASRKEELWLTSLADCLV